MATPTKRQQAILDKMEEGQWYSPLGTGTTLKVMIAMNEKGFVKRLPGRYLFALPGRFKGMDELLGAIPSDEGGTPTTKVEGTHQYTPESLKRVFIFDEADPVPEHLFAQAFPDHPNVTQTSPLPEHFLSRGQAMPCGHPASFIIPRNGTMTCAVCELDRIGADAIGLAEQVIAFFDERPHLLGKSEPRYIGVGDYPGQMTCELCYHGHEAHYIGGGCCVSDCNCHKSETQVEIDGLKRLIRLFYKAATGHGTFDDAIERVFGATGGEK